MDHYKFNNDPKRLQRLAEAEDKAGSPLVPFQGNFFLCGEEGLYQLPQPHRHPTQESANDCTLRWGVRMAMQRDKLLRAVVGTMNLIQGKAKRTFRKNPLWQKLANGMIRDPKGKKCGDVSEISKAVCDLEAGHLACLCGAQDMHSGLRPDDKERTLWFNQ